ncbi:hypothetical protein [Shewanella colwelliana]|uniref:DUF885 domain-containing protein n=1 Tax=Shewanella colwelliana TaxID=23 RepID=A0ABQ4P4N9_SHECO|nr:hypothetical protein [Shewanella colwelliana]MDX1280696.1 hypothetical protein [Shewanella colwelliana]GIU42488.1 hypothetical protein TUM3794_25920 [Shewanella colwelliana]
MSLVTFINCPICQQYDCSHHCVVRNSQVDNLAQQYVTLVLNVGLHQPLYVDAYYGPETWRQGLSLQPLPQLRETCQSLCVELGRISTMPLSHTLSERVSFLAKQLDSVAVFLRSLSGEPLSFTEESLGLYDVRAPKYTLDRFIECRDQLAKLVPGDGDLTARFTAYRQQFIVPSERVAAVFSAAVERARALTAMHIDLPENERFSIEYVTDKVWTAYNWYQGSCSSLIELNQDQPLYLERALELASHEGYPGHHVFNLLQERDLVSGRGWLEYAIYPLYSPISFLSEGSANYGLSLLMSQQERLEYERDVLMPLAGIEGDIVQYYQIMTLYKQLAYLDNLVCQQLTDGEIDDVRAAEMLVEFGLYTDSKAKQRVAFYRSNRSYVINYNYGEDCVREWVEKEPDSKRRWQRFEALLKRPRTASGFTR